MFWHSSAHILGDALEAGDGLVENMGKFCNIGIFGQGSKHVYLGEITMSSYSRTNLEFVEFFFLELQVFFG